MNSHHAVLLFVRDPEKYILEDVSEKTDRQSYTYEKLGIDDVRTITDVANRRPSGEAVSLEIVIKASTITVEAQQALLKIVEEPPVTTAFIFILPEGVQLLQTLLSRFSISKEIESEVTEVFTDFLAMSVSDRLSIIEKAVKDKDVSWQEGIKAGLMAHLNKSDRTLSQAQLETSQFVVSTLLTRGAANKMLLELLALTL